jgi:hypothetical protein
VGCAPSDPRFGLEGCAAGARIFVRKFLRDPDRTDSAATVPWIRAAQGLRGVMPPGRLRQRRTEGVRGTDMTVSLFLACLWVIVANVLAMLPSRDNHWTRAYVLMGLGLPLLGFVAWENGPWVALAMLVAGMSLLRWPLRYLLRWLRGKSRRQG